MTMASSHDVVWIAGLVRPPNTRVQRTRSSPSAHREPLTRCTLGGPKHYLVSRRCPVAPASM
jgi:hypothetical protein